MAARGAYFDTSVLVKRYVDESGSTGARELLGRWPVVSSALAPVEAMSALFRRVRAGQIAEREAHEMMRHLADDRAGWQLIGIDSSILGRAESLVRDVTLRALDAIHIASALMLVDSMAQRIPFVTADANQRAAAERANLEVVWIA